MGRKVLVDMVGLRYGRLVGLSFSHRGPSGHAHWRFSCDCGAFVVAAGSRVRSGNTTSCGCRHREISAARLTIHGHRARKRHGLTYRAWQAMKDGCNNPASRSFEAVGARGIAVCPAWLADYERFLSDMGERPAGTSLDRLDAGRDFAPGNCVWVLTPSRAARARNGWERRRSARAPASAAERSAPRQPGSRAEGVARTGRRAEASAATVFRDEAPAGERNRGGPAP